MSIDSLQEKIREMKNPTVVGLDPQLDHIPPAILEKNIRNLGNSLRAAAEAAFEFNCGLIDALCSVIPAVKPQSAYYEALGYHGVRVLAQTVEYAKSKGMFVILDVKRGDIGSTATAYSEAYLGSVKVGDTEIEPFGCDAMTINTYLGSDGIAPFIKTCRERDKCVFALVRTSNPSSGELQDLVAGDRLVHNVVGDLVERLGQDSIGKYGFSCVGAVVGATFTFQLKELRGRMKNTFFLVPGYGAQGGTAQDVRFAFNEYGHGAVINSSRGIICAWKNTGRGGADYATAAYAEAMSMKEAIKKFVNIV